MRVYINNRDLLTWPREMARVLAGQGHEVIFVDNASTYEPLLDFYAQGDYRVERLKDNVGSIAPWVMLREVEKSTDPYVVTDPDLDLSGVPDDWPEALAEGLALFDRSSKVGLSLDDTRVPSRNPAWYADRMCDHPNGHPATWSPSIRRMGEHCDFFLYPVDTTFALYRPGRSFTIDGGRAGRPYTARHMPWHIVPEFYLEAERPVIQVPMNDELHYYFTHAKQGMGGSISAGRLATMVAEYGRKKGLGARASTDL